MLNRYLGFPIRQINNYIPPIGNGVLRRVYDWSSIFYALAAVFLYTNGGGFYGLSRRRFGIALAVLMGFQPIFSYLGDSFEFMATGKNGIWGTIDRIWALAGFLCVILFMNQNQFYLFGPVSCATGMALGTVFWVVSMVVLRVECDLPRLWAISHILWHVLPTAGGMVMSFALKPL